MEQDQIIYYSTFSSPPNHLDPARSYNQNEGIFLDQIYEAPLQYHFLKRPYTLEPALLLKMPTIQWLNSQLETTQPSKQDIAFTEITLQLKSDVRYQPHPALAQDQNNQFYYHFATEKEGKAFQTLNDFSQTGTRTVTSDDLIYQIKRLANPHNKSPLLSMVSSYIVGVKEFQEQLKTDNRQSWQDLRNFYLTGVQKLDEHTLKIRIKGVYPQFIYWLATRFFAPIPWEADRFYHNPGFKQKNITLDWHPLGTGPFMMTRNNPNQIIVLSKNINYRPSYYPTEGEPEDINAGLLKDSGKMLPFIDKAIYKLERESIPLWRKFVQGYYDRSGESTGNITTATFDHAFNTAGGNINLSPEMQNKQIRMDEEIRLAIMYVAFNMNNTTVGGYSEKKRKLRQAISIVWDIESFINIFLNGLAEPAHSLLPPGLFGYDKSVAGFNPYVYDKKNNRPVRKSIALAKKLMTEAGYPGGRDEITGKPLTLYFDTVSTESSPVADWRRKQLAKLGIHLEFRVTDYNRFQEKVRSGNSQIFSWGWLADYPDPENFLFLLDGNQTSKACQCDGANSANYNNPEYTALYKQMKVLPNNEKRQQLINKMIRIIQQDAPWIWGLHGKNYYLSHHWTTNTKRHGITEGTLKYLHIDPKKRQIFQKQWNKPYLWPLLIAALLLLLLLILAYAAYKKRQSSPKLISFTDNPTK